MLRSRLVDAAQPNLTKLDESITVVIVEESSVQNVAKKRYMIVRERL